MSTTYGAYVTREGRFWMITVPETDSLTQARNLAEAQLMAREVIASDLDVPLSEVDVDLHLSSIDGIIDVQERLAGALMLRAEVAHYEQAAQIETRDLAQELVASGVTVRDVGHLLGMSHQRVHQLVQPGPLTDEAAELAEEARRMAKGLIAQAASRQSAGTV